MPGHRFCVAQPVGVLDLLLLLLCCAGFVHAQEDGLGAPHVFRQERPLTLVQLADAVMPLDQVKAIC